MKNKFTSKSDIFLIIFFYLILQINLKAEVIKEFIINGNDRVADETIIIFSNLNVGDEVTQQNLNETLKELYQTNYFENISINFVDGIVNINVKENPIIQSVIINGIKKDSMLEKIKTITSKVEKYPFVESAINDQINLLKNILKSYGYYFVKLDTSIQENSNNSVNLIYDFKLGDIAKIKKINFIGDKIFRDNTLRNVILSEETKFWKFLTNNKFLNANRINLDVARLDNFYKNRGFFKASIKSTTAVITNENQFELIFNINAGKKFYFNDISFVNKENLPEETLSNFQKKFSKLKNKKYSKKIINNLINDLNDYTLLNDFVFINASFEEKELPENKINVIVNFEDIKKQYVERINIYGNFITDEKVLRNALIIDEGDPFNEVLFKKSVENIKAKNIFKSVKYNITKDKYENRVIDLTVEEKATGEIFAGAGAGTTGTSVSGGIKENNYLGLGIKLDTNLAITDDAIKGKFSVTNPNYNNSDKSLKTSLESTTSDFMSSSGYKTSRTGFSIGTEFEQLSDFFVNLEISNFYEDLKTSSSATSIVKKQEGNYFENLLAYSLTYNKLDQNFQPSDGFINRFSQKLPIYSDDLSIENSFSSSIYHSINDNLILSAKLLIKTINSIDDNVRISKRVFIPGRLLRGFESGKIGPKDGSQYIGGNYATSLNLSSTLPNILYENENIDFNFFIDLANVWEVDYNSSLDSNKIRSSTGLAINWFSGIGPLTFSYAIPLSEADTDITEKFRFQIGTSF